MKALLIDDHAILRSGLKRLLTDVRKMTIFEAASGYEALEIQRQERPGFIISDLELPDINGFDLLRSILQGDPATKVLVFSMYDLSKYAALSLKIGAKGYVSKNVSPDELRTAIREVSAGHSYIEAEIADRLKNTNNRDPNKSTEREADLLRLLAQGQSYTEIANSWGRSYKTVANTAGQIRARLNLASTAELIRFATQLYRLK